MRLFLAIAGLAAVLSVPASAQVVYEPVRYQYRAPNGGGVFYYGGQDPYVFRQATITSIDPGFGRVQGYAFLSTTRAVRSSRAPVFSDVFPGVDLSGFGLTAKDASNYARLSLPTYFRKSDLKTQAVQLPDGSRHIPASASPVSTPTPTARPAASSEGKGVVIIIPYRKSAPGSPEL
jgi:hypothetical protein